MSSSDHSARLPAILDFLRQADRLKNVTRSGFTSEGRPDSVAEHTWRLCLMALLFEESFPEVDFARLVKMCIVHDLGEALGGDVPAPIQAEAASKGEGPKADAELRDLLRLLEPLPRPLRA